MCHYLDIALDIFSLTTCLCVVTDEKLGGVEKVTPDLVLVPRFGELYYKESFAREEEDFGEFIGEFGREASLDVMKAWIQVSVVGRKRWRVL